MGANAATSINESSKETLMKTATKSVTEFGQNNESLGELVQLVRIINGVRGVMRCNVRVLQEANMEVGAVAHMSDDAIVDTANSMLDSYLTETEKQMEQQNEKLNLGQINIATDIRTMRQSLKVEFETTMVRRMKQVVKVNGTINQTVIIENYGLIDGKECVFDQKGCMSLIAQALTSTALQQITDNSVVSQTLEKYKLTMSQKNSGINPFELGLYFLYAILGIAGAVVLVYAAYYLSGSTAPSPGQDAAAVIQAGSQAAGGARGGGGMRIG